MKIALAGNPNSGKTTLFNALTGANETVGNWAGVTVEKKEQYLKKSLCPDGERPLAVDLPGAYSMSPFTTEESVTRDYVQNEHPDVLINIVDSTNLSRSLFFTTQLLELGIPTVIALNKTDVNDKKETQIDAARLSILLDCPVVQIVSTAARGLEELMQAVSKVAGKPQLAPYKQGKIDLTDRAAVEAADRARFAFVDGIVSAVETRKVLTRERNLHDKIDALLTNRWLGIPIFAAVMFLVFQISQAWLGIWIAEGIVFNEGAANEWAIPGLVTLIDWFGTWVGGLMEGADPLLSSILLDGIIGGVGAVVGFLPLVMVMYFLLALLEDCGYMARVTVVLDPIFKKVGLSGKSVIPFVIGTGCAVPGVMASRTIRSTRERRATALLAPFMPCGAKLPVISLFAGAFFGEAPWVGTLMYFVGILLIFLCALLINAVTGAKRQSYFIIELPEYKLPSALRAALSMLRRGWAYIVKAGTVILVCNFAVQLMQSFSWSLQPVDNAADSILAGVALPFAYLFAPIVGVVAWQLAAAAITGFIAKENVVGTLAVCFVGLENLIHPEELELIVGAGGEVAAVLAISKAAALAYLMFNLFSPPCFAAIGAMNAELKSKKWLAAGITLQFGVGYCVGFLAFFFGTLFTTRDFGPIWMPILGWCLVACFAALPIGLILHRKRSEAVLKNS